MTTTINTDLLTPLGAYLRLRAMGRASFLLESVERGRLGRNSWMGAGSRLVAFEEAESARPPRGRVPRLRPCRHLEPTVPLPTEGREFPESRLVVAETLVRFDHGAGTADVLAGDADEIAGRLEGGVPWHRETRGVAGELRRFPDRARYEEMVRARQRAHRRGRRLPGRPFAASRAAHVRVAARRLPSAAPRQPLPIPLSAGARRDRARRLVAGAARRVRGRPSEPLPDRGYHRADRGRCRTPALVREGQGRARDARRPGPQRPLARVPRRHRARRALDGGGAVLPRLAPRLRGRRRATRRRDPFDVLRACFPAGTVSGAPKVRAMQLISELEGFRRGPYAGAVLYALPGGTMDACIALRTS